MNSAVGKLRLALNRCNPAALSLIGTVQSRYSSYKSSPFVCDLEDVSVKYETSKSLEDWKYVERILPPTVVPEFVEKPEYPSEWKPQRNVSDQPYYIPRNKNHMIPVYLKTSQRGIKRLTYVRKVQGDIWLLEKQLREFLQQSTIRPIRSQVNEFVGYICFHGDHVNAIKYWLMQRNF